VSKDYILGAILLLAACGTIEPEAAAEPEDGCAGGKCDTSAGGTEPDAQSAGSSSGANDFGPEAGDATFSVRHYDYRFSLADRHAQARLHLEIEADGACIEIPMRTEAPGTVHLDGVPAQWSFDGERLRACGEGMVDGASVILDVLDFEVPLETWRSSQVGYSERSSPTTGDFHYGQSWVGQCDRLGPCDPSPGTFATYRFEIEHGPQLQVLCPGTIERTEEVTVCTFDFDGGPTYSTFSFAASDRWVEHDLGTWGHVRVTLYDLPGGGLRDQLDAELHAAFLEWMEDHFGPYPYGDELRIFAAPLFWGGFEHPGNIVLDRGLVGPGAVTTMHHEIAHMWAGNQTTLATVHDFVWKEAMAEYLPFVFADERDMPTPGTDKPLRWRSGGMSSRFFPVPLERPELLDFYGDVYSAGPMTLFRQTEALFGRDAILGALRRVLGQPRVLGIEDLREALERSTARSLSPYSRVCRTPSAACRTRREEGVCRAQVTDEERSHAGRGRCYACSANTGTGS
jgi:aminopeptidase N